MAAMQARNYSPGDHVLMYNIETNDYDTEGFIEEVVNTDAVFCDNGQLPVGSIRVRTSNGPAPMWIRPEHADLAMKRTDTANFKRQSVADDGEDEEDEDEFMEGCQVVATKEFEASARVLGFALGPMLGSARIQKGTVGVVEEIDDEGSVIVSFQGIWSQSVVRQEMRDCLEVVAPPKEAAPAVSVTSLGPTLFSHMSQMGFNLPSLGNLKIPSFDGKPVTMSKVTAGREGGKLSAAPPTLTIESPRGNGPDHMGESTSGGSGSNTLQPPNRPDGSPSSPSSFCGSPRSPGGCSPCNSPRSLEDVADLTCDRASRRVLAIGAGFGADSSSPLFKAVEDAGFQLHVVLGLPNPDVPGFPVQQFLTSIKQAIDEFQPHVVVCASVGGAYMNLLWQTGVWVGPSLVINKHPHLVGPPKDVPVVLCHGSNDEFYRFTRADLETFARTGTPNRTFLYFTGNSGLLGQRPTREGDRHCMGTLLQYDCLPRLLDAAMCGGDPGMHLIKTWDEMVTEERLKAEQWLGYQLEDLKRLWESCRGDDNGIEDSDKVLFDLFPSTDEYMAVEALFLAQPKVPRAYLDMNPGMWQDLTILKIQRVENAMQEEGNAAPYYRALQRDIESQGLKFRPGLHTRWLFHGSSAIEEIVSDPIAGFQPLMSGSRAASLWGPGTYFARDAKYVYDGGFCKVLPDGSRQMLLCLLMTGIPCLGDPSHRGVLPVRTRRHRFNSSVDSLSNPEIFVTQSPGAAYPAYVITFK